MKVSIGQIYVKPGINFPFTHLMQLWLGEELSSIITSTPEFSKKFSPNYDLTIRISADDQIIENKIKGPTIYKKDKDVEYTVFLPYKIITVSPEGCRLAVEFLVDGIITVLHNAGLDTEVLNAKKEIIVIHICSEPSMLKKPWPRITTAK